MHGIVVVSVPYTGTRSLIKHLMPLVSTKDVLKAHIAIYRLKNGAPFDGIWREHFFTHKMEVVLRSIEYRPAFIPMRDPVLGLMTTAGDKRGEWKPEMRKMYLECWDNLIGHWEMIESHVHMVDVRDIPHHVGKSKEREHQIRYLDTGVLPSFIVDEFGDWIEHKRKWLSKVFPQVLEPRKRAKRLHVIDGKTEVKPIGQTVKPRTGGMFAR